MSVQSISGYSEFLEEAGQYHGVAKNGRVKRPEIYNNEILYNILGLAIEKYIMALMNFYGEMPEGHTFYDLLAAAKTKINVPEDIGETLIELESYQNLCPVFNPHGAKSVPDKAITTMITITDRISKLVREKL